MAKVADILEAHAIGMPVNEAVELLKQILGVESDTIKRLDRIEAKVDRLLGTPYKAAIEYVESASIPGLSDHERQRRLDGAHGCLINAIAAAGPDLTACGAAEVALASLHYLRQEHTDAGRYAERAYRTSVAAVAEAVDQANVLKVGKLPVVKFKWEHAKWRDAPGVWGALDFANDFFRGQRTKICVELRNRSNEVREIAIHLGALVKDLPKMELIRDQHKAMWWNPVGQRSISFGDVVWVKCKNCGQDNEAHWGYPDNAHWNYWTARCGHVRPGPLQL
jgi:hypothetical protein